MTGATPVVISAAVEGPVDEAVVRALVHHVGAVPGEVYGKYGKLHLRQKVGGYNNAARYAPWIVLVDLDRDADCAPPLRRTWLPDAASHMCFRVAVREVEAWLLADRARIARFLVVPVSRIPSEPETLDDPKSTMVALARRSRRKEIREDMVPRLGSGRSAGPAYASRLIEFVSAARDRWRPEEASRRSDSLRRTLECLQRLTRAGRTGRAP